MRAIARDVGAALGVGGHLTALRRTAVGPFGLDVAHTLDELADAFTVLPIADAARAAFPRATSTTRPPPTVRVGRTLDVHLDGLTALFAPDGEFLALYEPRDGAPAPSRSSSEQHCAPCTSGAPSTRCRPTSGRPSW